MYLKKKLIYELKLYLWKKEKKIDKCLHEGTKKFASSNNTHFENLSLSLKLRYLSSVCLRNRNRNRNRKSDCPIRSWMEAIRKQATKLREQVARQQQVLSLSFFQTLFDFFQPVLCLFQILYHSHLVVLYN